MKTWESAETTEFLPIEKSELWKWFRLYFIILVFYVEKEYKKS